MLRPPWDQGTFVPFPLDKPLLLPWVTSDLRLWYHWCTSTLTCEGGSGPGRGYDLMVVVLLLNLPPSWFPFALPFPHLLPVLSTPASFKPLPAFLLTPVQLTSLAHILHMSTCRQLFISLSLHGPDCLLLAASHTIFAGISSCYSSGEWNRRSSQNGTEW